MIEDSLEGNLILTPNRRSAVFLERELCYREEHYQIHPVDCFIRETYQNNLFTKLEPKLVVSNLQRHAIVQNIINKSKYNSGLLRISSTTDKVIQAISYMKNWMISKTDFSLHSSYDTDVFLSWYSEYEITLSRMNMVDEDDLISSVSSVISSADDFWFNKIILFGFNEIIPSLSILLQKFNDICIFCEYKTHAYENENSRLEFSTAEDEWESAARWAKYNLNNGYHNVAVVVPELATYRKEVSNIFHKYFESKDINISAPSSLLNYPLIKDAVCTLSLIKETIAFKDFSYWLRHCHSFAEGSKYKPMKAMFEKELRGVGQQVFTRQYVEKLLSNHKEYSNCSWIQGLIAAIHKVEKQNNVGVLKWSYVFEEILSIMSWGEDILKTKNNMDLLVCWSNSVNEFRTLEKFSGEIDFNTALDIFQQVITNTPFLPETEKAKIHVLGMLEASGIAFDKIWVTGMNEDSWPQSPDPNPFIPGYVQRKYDLPRSTSVREYNVAKIITKSFAASSKYGAIFSYPILINELGSRGSSLVMEISLVSDESINKEPKKINHLPIELCTYDDSQGIALKDNLLIKQGVQMMQDQANCPFRSYARHRLECKDLDNTNIGFSPKEHGQLLHSVLADIWQDLKNSDSLLNLTKEKLEFLVSCKINRRVKEYGKNIAKGLISLEVNRLQRKITEWLDFEKSRGDFKVQAIEKKVKFSLQGISFFVRLDRIDETSENCKTVIDYKTGTINPYSWFSNRITEPQLPLYMIIPEVEAKGVVAGSFKNNEYVFKGLSESSEFYPGAKEIEGFADRIKGDVSLKSLKEQWATSFSNIVLEYKSAQAKVKPVNGSTTCRSCGFRLLCRKDAINAKIV